MIFFTAASESSLLYNYLVSFQIRVFGNWRDVSRKFLNARCVVSVERNASSGGPAGPSARRSSSSGGNVLKSGTIPPVLPTALGRGDKVTACWQMALLLGGQVRRMSSCPSGRREGWTGNVVIPPRCCCPCGHPLIRRVNNALWLTSSLLDDGNIVSIKANIIYRLFPLKHSGKEIRTLEAPDDRKRLSDRHADPRPA